MTEKKPAISNFNIEGNMLETFFGPLEVTIIKVIWASKKRPLTVREVYETVKKKRKIAYTTVMSTMDRLHDKGMLDRQIEKGKGGIHYVYWPKLEEQTFKKSAVREVINSLIENFGEIVTSCFVEKAASSEEELKTLTEQLEKIMKEKKREQ
jgi:predicted transcriptional regulator